MKKYIRIKFSDFDFLDFRLGGPGLGNLLFVWARAIVYAEKQGLKIISPNWRTFKLGPYLRFEKDKRLYNSLFIKSGITGIKKYILQLISMQLIQSTRIKSASFIPEVITFSGMNNQMNDIINDYAIVKKKLFEILSDDVIKLTQTNDLNYIGVHLRFGDFQPENEDHLRAGKTNTRISINWYVTQINKLKRHFGSDTNFMIFSDGSKDELSKVLSMENVKHIEGGNALSDLILLSQSKIIIASNSTFSLWASYLGRCHTIWFPGTKRFNLFHDHESCQEFELDYKEELPLNLKI